MHSQIVVNPRFHRGTKIGKGDQFWQPKSVRGERFWRGTDFFVTVATSYSAERSNQIFGLFVRNGDI